MQEQFLIVNLLLLQTRSARIGLTLVTMGASIAAYTLIGHAVPDPRFDKDFAFIDCIETLQHSLLVGQALFLAVHVFIRVMIRKRLDLRALLQL